MWVRAPVAPQLVQGRSCQLVMTGIMAAAPPHPQHRAPTSMPSRRSAAVAYERRIQQRLSDITGRVRSADPTGTVTDVTRVLTDLNKAVQRHDSSNGFLNRLFDRARAVHAEAVAADPPRPTRLAEVLWRLAQMDPLDGFVTAYPDYAEPLGEEGRARYRALALAAFDDLPPPAGRSGYTPGALAPTAVLQAIAQHDDDVELLEQASCRDLVHPYGYVRLVQRLRALGAPDRAVHWAREGLGRFAVGDDTRLSVAAVEAMLDAGEVDEALTVARAHLLASPTPSGWRAFAAAAAATGLTAEETAAVLDELVSDAPVDRVVAILLDVGEVDRAWDVADRRGADRRSWTLLAEAMASRDPARAAQVRHREVEEALQSTSKAAYNRVVSLLLHLRDLHEAADDMDGFHLLVQRIRADHHRRTAMLGRMDAAGL
jgi:hypothetical protein